jgi:hypothetical protein
MRKTKLKLLRGRFGSLLKEPDYGKRGDIYVLFLARGKGKLSDTMGEYVEGPFQVLERERFCPGRSAKITF